MAQQDDQLTRIEKQVARIEKKLDEQSGWGVVYFLCAMGFGVIALGAAAISLGINSKTAGSVVTGTFGVFFGALLLFLAGLSANRKLKQRGS